jgi:hypothetical protein
MGEVVTKKDIKEILEEIGADRDNKNPYLIYKDDTGKIEMTIVSQPEITKNGERDIIGNVWKQKWAKVEMKVKVYTEGLEHIKVLEMGGATDGKPSSALFKAFAINFDRNDLDFDDIVGTKWSLGKDVESGWYNIEYLGVDSELDDTEEEEEKPKEVKKEEKPKAKKEEEKPKTSSKLSEVLEIIKGLKDEPEFEEGVHKDKFITAIALRGSVSMDDVDKLISTLVKQDVIVIDEDENVTIN